MKVAAPVYPFIKMHAAGNDFAIFDCREWNEAQIQALSHPSTIAYLAHRRWGIGCDQIILIEKEEHKGYRGYVRFFNADGSCSDSCGNGARCVAWFLASESLDSAVALMTEAGPLEARVHLQEAMVDVMMGKVSRKPNGLFLRGDVNPDSIDVGLQGLPKGIYGSIGNPHIVFFVADVSHISLGQIGPIIENHPFFPQRVNVHFAQIISENALYLRTWERGSGETFACGSGACVASVVACQLHDLQFPVQVHQKGGCVVCSQKNENGVILSGPVKFVFSGMVDIQAEHLGYGSVFACNRVR